MINPNGPAFAPDVRNQNQNFNGLTIRAYIATQMMAALTSGLVKENVKNADIACVAVGLADALVSELNKELQVVP